MSCQWLGKKVHGTRYCCCGMSLASYLSKLKVIPVISGSG